jgi:NAD(P)H-dependent FMN reductase
MAVAKVQHIHKLDPEAAAGYLNILGVAGSMRRNSYSTMALKSVLKTASESYGAQVHLLDLSQTPLPIYDPALSAAQDSKLGTASKLVRWADAFILASPDYHGSMSGVMKNFLDHFWEEFSGKTFGYIVASHEKGLTVMDQMRTAVRQCYGWSVPYGISVNGEQDYDSNGELRNSRLAKRINMLARDLTVYGKIIRDQFKLDLAGDEQNTFAAHFRQ